MSFAQQRAAVRLPVLLGGLVVLMAFGIAVDVAGRHLAPGIALTGVDADVTVFLAERRRPWLTALATAMSWTADLLVVVILVVGLGVTAGVRHGRWHLLWVPALAGAGALAISVVVKTATGRPRPPVTTGIVDAHGWAFPSGHAIRAIAVYAAIAWVSALWVRRRRARAVVWALALLLIAGVGFARIYLGVHWLTDVLGGYALGALWLRLLLSCTRWPTTNRR